MCFSSGITESLHFMCFNPFHTKVTFYFATNTKRTFYVHISNVPVLFLIIILSSWHPVYSEAFVLFSITPRQHNKFSLLAVDMGAERLCVNRTALAQNIKTEEMLAAQRSKRKLLQNPVMWHRLHHSPPCKIMIQSRQVDGHRGASVFVCVCFWASQSLQRRS